MNLFHETENKYYELLTRLLMSDKQITDASISECWDKYIIENSLIADDLLVLEPYTKSTDAKIKFNILK